MTRKMDAFTKRAWRTAAIYRCCRTRGMSRSWALEKIRAISPEGARDHLVDLWFVDMDRLRERNQARSDGSGLIAGCSGSEFRMAA